jgi:hypothetical protein
MNLHPAGPADKPASTGLVFPQGGVKLLAMAAKGIGAAGELRRKNNTDARSTKPCSVFYRFNSRRAWPRPYKAFWSLPLELSATQLLSKMKRKMFQPRMPT